MTALEACPWCKDQAILDYYEQVDYPNGVSSAEYWTIGCSNNKCIIGIILTQYTAFDSEQDAIAAWNTRSALAPRDVGALKREVWEHFDGAIQNTSSVNLGRFASNVIDHLASIGAIGGAAEGYVMVPKEPTEEMCRKGVYRDIDLTMEIDEATARSVYRAMIAAASNAWMKEPIRQSVKDAVAGTPAPEYYEEKIGDLTILRNAETKVNPEEK